MDTAQISLYTSFILIALGILGLALFLSVIVTKAILKNSSFGVEFRGTLRLEAMTEV